MQPATAGENPRNDLGSVSIRIVFSRKLFRLLAKQVFLDDWFRHCSTLFEGVSLDSWITDLQKSTNQGEGRGTGGSGLRLLCPRVAKWLVGRWPSVRALCPGGHSRLPGSG